MTNKDDLKVAEETIYGIDYINALGVEERQDIKGRIAQALATQRQQLIGEMLEGVKKNGQTEYGKLVVHPAYEKDPKYHCGYSAGMDDAIKFIKSKLTK